MFAFLRLLPMSDRDKDVEILALRHQITVLERQLGTTRPRFTPTDRTFLAALLHRLPRGRAAAGSGCWSGRTRCCAGTATCWPDATATRSRPRRPGRPRTVRSIRAAGAAPGPGEPVAGATGASTANSLALGIKVAASTVWEILKQAGIEPGTRARTHHLGQLPPLPGRRPAGLRLLRDRSP